MFDRLEAMLKQYNLIQEKLSTGTLEVKKMTELLKESANLKDAVDNYLIFKSKSEELDSLKEMIEIETDAELKEMASFELHSLEDELKDLTQKLKILLLPKDPNDDKNIIMEIKGAAGGDEANIFAGDLYRMYARFAEANGWKIEVLSAMEGTMGGFASLEILITGQNIYSKLKYESGTHRVQRVPQTESQGRVHTSTATVLVMPEAEDIELDISWNDIRMDTFNSSGPGGQSVNTTKSAVRLTYIPTGLSVSIQDGKSQHENRATAYKVLIARLYDQILNEQLEKEGAERKALVGRGDRSEKIRTYNYPQNRITDHRIGLTLQRLDSVIDGRLELIIEPIINEYQRRQLVGEI